MRRRARRGAELAVRQAGNLHVFDREVLSRTTLTRLVGDCMVTRPAWRGPEVAQATVAVLKPGA